MPEVLNCGFARSLVLSGTAVYHSSNVFDNIYHDYDVRFAGMAAFSSTKGYMIPRFKEYAKLIRSKKVDSKIKNAVKETFSGEVWNKLSRDDKDKHTLKECKVNLFTTYNLC